MLKLVICDWNRTLFEDKYEEIFFRGLSRHVLLQAVKKFNIPKVYILWRIKNKCNNLLLQVNNGDKYIKDIINILNENIIRDLPLGFLNEYTKKYAKNAVKRLDKRILEPLKRLRLSKGIKLGIISSGYISGIEQTLKNAGYIFDFIKANDFEINGDTLIRFKLDVFNNKKEILKKVLTDYSMNSKETIYIGDDWQDEECFEEVGYPVVSFLAEEKYKKSFSGKFSAFVPEDEDTFREYLLKNL